MEDERAKRDAENEALLGALLARAYAAETMLGALVASHPQPEVLREIWQRAALEASDDGFTVGPLAGYSDQLRARLAALSGSTASAEEAGLFAPGSPARWAPELPGSR